MHRAAPIVLAITLLATASCRRAGSSQLQGKWKGTKAEGVAESASNDANNFASQMEVEVKGDVITVTSPSQKQTSRYEVKSQDKTTVVITTDKNATSPAGEETFTFVDDKTMKWAVFDGKTITFAKQ